MKSMGCAVVTVLFLFTAATASALQPLQIANAIVDEFASPQQLIVTSSLSASRHRAPPARRLSLFAANLSTHFAAPARESQNED